MRPFRFLGVAVDVVGRGDPTSITLAATAEKIAWVREAAGDRFGDLELNVYPSMSEVTVTDHARAEAAKLRDKLRQETRHDVGEGDLLESPQVFIGSIDGLAEKFRALREQLGIRSFMVGGIDELAPVVERLAGS